MTRLRAVIGLLTCSWSSGIRHLLRELHRHLIQREALPDLVETQSSAAALLALRAAEAS
jgi:hypothetical protein